jgi:hypothetical protein
MVTEEFKTRRRRVRLIWGIAVLVLSALVIWGLLPRPIETDFATADLGRRARRTGG